MQPQPRHRHRAADPVISGIVDVLQVKGEEDAAPDVGGVERYLDGFAAVGESAIAQKKSQAAIGQICLMRFRDAARHERDTSAVEAAMPARSLGIRPQLRAFVIFCVSKRLVLSFVPSPPAERPNVAGHLLLETKSEAILDRKSVVQGKSVDLG